MSRGQRYTIVITGLVALVLSISVLAVLQSASAAHGATSEGNSGAALTGPNIPGDEAWDARFGLSGVDGGFVYAVATVGNDLYVAGNFTRAGNTPVNGIARWNGSTWLPLSTGLNGIAYAMATDGTNLYVGGEFTLAGGYSVSKLARWDGTRWYPVGGGVDGSVYALTFSGGSLYVGGGFVYAGGMTVNAIARWNGSQWSALGSGALGRVNDIAVAGNNVYVGGDFTEAGGIAANRIAKWNGSQWSALGSGVNNYVNAVAVDSATGNVYAGGTFTTAGGVSAALIARWDGTQAQWFPMGSGLGGGYQDVWSIAIGNGDGEGNIYVGGRFVTAGGTQVNYISRWDGAAWHSMGGGVGMAWGTTNVLSVASMVVSGNSLYIGGEFTDAGGLGAKRVARWDGNQWNSIGDMAGGVNNALYRLVLDGSAMYAGGAFVRAGRVAANHIARWDGNTWNALGSGVNGDVRALAVSGTDVYVGGDFTQAGGVPASKIARWDGSAWHPLGSGVDGTVYALAVVGSDLYVGGSFTTAGGLYARYIAKWNGIAWSAVGAGVENGVNAAVREIVADGTNLYVGGEFTVAGSATQAKRIARWDGSQWSTLGSGLNDIVRAIAIDGSAVYAGGQFTMSGGTYVGYIARWDGSQWSPLANGVNGSVNDIALSGGTLYAAGSFDSATGVAANRVARWTGSTWQALGSGLDNVGETLALSGSNPIDLYVGGWLTMAGDKLSQGLGLWHEQLVASPTPTRTPTAAITVTPSCSSLWQSVYNPPRNGQAYLLDVVALSADNIWAVGLYGPDDPVGGRGLIEHWDGTRWSVERVPIIYPSYSLSAIDAVSANDIWALGDGPVILHYDGSNWTQVASPPAQGAYIEDVAAISANDVWAVGEFVSASSATLTLHWDGVNWSVVDSPNASSHSNYLHSVYAASSDDVWAVGESNQNQDSLAMHWDGSAWTIVPTPHVGSGGNQLFTVGGVGSNNIWALGDIQYTAGALVLHWDGNEWTGTADEGLGASPRSIDVVSASNIWVAGYLGDQTSEAAISHWDGVRWSTELIPTNYQGARLSGIAATGPDIWAVGRQHDFDPYIVHKHMDTCGQPTSTPFPTPTAPPAPPACGNYAYALVGGAVVPGDTLVAGSQCDDCAVTVPLPFTYSFYGQPYDSVQLGSNGVASFAGGENDPINECLPVEGMQDMIAVYWDNLDMSSSMGAGLGIYTFVSGGAPNRIFNIEWRACRRGYDSCKGTVNFELQLYEGQSRFDIVLGEQSNTNGSATIGAQKDGAWSYYTSYVCSLAYASPSKIVFVMGYSDVLPDSAFYTYVNCLSCRNILSGYSDGTFRPNNLVTRGQLSKIVSNSAGFNDDPGPQIFEDVPPGSTFYDWVNRLANRGYISGYPCGGEGEPCGQGSLPYFRTNTNATRGQISKIVSNAAGYDDIPASQTFEDVPPSNTFYLWIERLASRGIMGGYPCGGEGEPCGQENKPYFRWGNNATRGQTSKIVANTFFPNCQTPLRRFT